MVINYDFIILKTKIFESVNLDIKIAYAIHVDYNIKLIFFVKKVTNLTKPKENEQANLRNTFLIGNILSKTK